VKGCQLVISKKFLAPSFRSGFFRNDGVDCFVTWFWREEVRRLGSQAINVCLQLGRRLPVSFVISEFTDLVRVKVSDLSSISTDILP